MRSSTGSQSRLRLRIAVPVPVLSTPPGGGVFMFPNLLAMMLFPLWLLLLLSSSSSIITNVEAIHGGNRPNIETYGGWIPIEVVTEGDVVVFFDDDENNVGGYYGGYEIAGNMDGIGAFLVTVPTSSSSSSSSTTTPPPLDPALPGPPTKSQKTATAETTTTTKTLLRIQVNHELVERARITELNLDVDLLKRSIHDSFVVMANTNTNTAILPFVQSARLAYDTFTYLQQNDDDNDDDDDRETTDGSSSSILLTTTSLVDPTLDRDNDDDDDDGTTMMMDPAADFCKFCSSQSYRPHTFGSNRGFVDQLYITGEECSGGRLVVVDSSTRQLHQLSGVTQGGGHGGGDSNNNVLQPAGFAGIPYDSFENAALIDTGETDHVALLLSSHGGSRTLKLYVGVKGADTDGRPVEDNSSSSSFLARNGLLFGRWYYLAVDDDEFTEDGEGKRVVRGTLTNDDDEAWNRPAFEDIDTNPNNPVQVILAESSTGVYLLDFKLFFNISNSEDTNVVNSSGAARVADADADAVGSAASTSRPSSSLSFNPSSSQFTVTQLTNIDNEQYRQPDNIDWTLNNLIFVNRDSDEGGIWYMNPDGTGKTRIGQTVGSTESTGILDLSPLLDYPPSSVMITTDQLSEGSSMTLLLNPTLRQFFASTGGGGDGGDGGDDTQDEIVVETSNPAPDLPIPPPRPSDCPPSSSRLENQVIQAEDNLVVGGNVRTNQRNWCGTGYVEFDDMMALSTVGIEFNVDISTPGTYRIKVRYANGDRGTLFDGGREDRSPGRPGMFFVDGQDQRNDFIFAPTNGWSLWNEESRTAQFYVTGRHTIEIWWGAGEKRPIIDWASLNMIEIIRDPEVFATSLDE